MIEHYGVGTYRKRPVEIQALRWTGSNLYDVEAFIADPRKGHITFESPIPVLYLRTLEGIMRVSVDDFVIRGVKGEFYPCKPDIFEATYEPVKGSDARRKPDRSINKLIYSIKLAYSRNGRISLTFDSCDFCEEVAYVLDIDASDGEYGDVKICRSCVIKAFDTDDAR